MVLVSVSLASVPQTRLVVVVVASVSLASVFLGNLVCVWILLPGLLNWLILSEIGRRESKCRRQETPWLSCALCR